MEVYKHTWKDKKTGRVEVAEGRTALNIEEAIEQFIQEDSSSWEYDHTIALNLEARTFRWLDMKDIIAARERDETPDYIQNDNIQMQRGFDDAKEALNG